jgi:hypothetical protein
MNLTDAAHMIRLQREADRGGIRRRLKFNKETKTRADLASYINKSKKVRNEDELLTKAKVPPGAALPSHITYEDDVPNPPQAPLLSQGDYSAYWPVTVPNMAAPTMLNVPLAASPNHSKLGTPVSSLSQRSSFSSFEQMDFSNSNIGFHAAVSQEEIQDGFDFEDEMDGPNNDEVLECVARVGRSPCFEAASDQILYPRPGAISPVQSIFGYLSSTPLSLQYQTSCPISTWTHGAVMEFEYRTDPPSDNTATTPVKESRATSFLSRCFYACMCIGQSREEGIREDLEQLAYRAIDEAMLILAGMIQVRDGKTLSTLSILLVMFESLGQLELAQTLLRKALEVSKQEVGPEHALTATIDWMVSVPDRSSHFKGFSTERFQTLRNSIAAEFGATSDSALVASYNVGWALLIEKHSDKAEDALRLDKAADLLGSLRNQCEQILGPHHLQTIMVSVTLARVYFHRGSLPSAETLIGEMISRLEKAFQPLHPYLLEALRRQALFLQKLGKHADAERILLRVVRERFSVLGPFNSRSKSSLEELRSSMAKRGASIEIVELHRQIKAQSQKYEFERKREAYQWSHE